MDLITITAVALSLSFDTFAVSLSFGVVKSKILFRQAVRVALVFAVFQAGFLVAGYFLGSVISDLVKAADHWIALILLAFLGIRMIVEGVRRKEGDEVRDYTKTLTLVATAIGTSIDAFAIGISFAFLDMRIWLSGVIIGAVTFLASMTAIRIGKSAGPRLGQKVEIAGGLILIAIGVKIFVEHMFG
ncbi:MAG TPA: manganese efflux pump MntP family protein [Bacteroidales bacterium]|jgi:putative Mn2+ efflux pump MntP|nr:manganese efflux pump MntP family protein [Bacteroidales bacterium]HOX73327.1 manganese efflux pump MntP family protein [Bacteroidales bacterium]HPM86575.1 manganese efflux pump MntP family protein [Bacteroidales bacterium]HQM67851.1 manganese efflux pump MntP family protein [Bacteroidales bacterium]